MPQCAVRLYRERDGRIPFQEWLLSIGQANARSRDRRVHYRVLYFFDGPAVAVIALGCTKGDEVGDAEIDRAAHYRNAFLSDRLVHLA